MSVTYKIGQNDFDAIFLPDSSEACFFGANYFLMKMSSKSFVQIVKFASYLSIVAFFSQKVQG